MLAVRGPGAGEAWHGRVPFVHRFGATGWTAADHVDAPVGAGDAHAADFCGLSARGQFFIENWLGALDHLRATGGD